MLGTVLGIGYSTVNKIDSALKELKEHINWAVLLQCDKCYNRKHVKVAFNRGLRIKPEKTSRGYVLVEN